MIKISITLDSLVDTRYYLLSKIDPIYMEPEYLNGYINRDTDNLPFIGVIFRDEYLRRHRVYAANAFPTSLNTFFRVYIMDIINKHSDSIEIDLNIYPYYDLTESEKNNLKNALYRLYKVSKVNVICEEPSSQLYSKYKYVVDYDGLRNVLQWINCYGEIDDILNTTIIAPLINEEAGVNNIDFKELSENITNLLSNTCKFDLVPPSLFSLITLD